MYYSYNIIESVYGIYTLKYLLWVCEYGNRFNNDIKIML